MHEYLYIVFYIKYYYTLHKLLQYKGNNTIWVFCGIFAEEGYHPMYTPNIYNVEEDNALSLGLKTPTTGTVLKIRYIFS